MRLTLRWFGPDDPVTLASIRQIPGVTGVVSAVHGAPSGAPWREADVAALADHATRHELALDVIESIPVHESVKLGSPDAADHTASWIDSLRAVAAVGVPVVCYNFMPLFDWLRTDLARSLPDGSTALAFDRTAADGWAGRPLSEFALPGWLPTVRDEEFADLSARFASLGHDALWSNLARFLGAVAPEASRLGVKLAIHPDDPPWDVLGVPRIVTSGAALRRVCEIVDDPASGVTLCTGSLGASPANDLPAIARELAPRVHFLHARNVRRTGEQSFHESAHPREAGDVDLPGVVAALRLGGFDGPVRPDHGRMIWGEAGRPGYGLYDRALGAAYLRGVLDALESSADS